MLHRTADDLVREASQLKGEGRFSEAKSVREQLEKIYDNNAVAKSTDKTKNLNQLAYLAVCCNEPAEAIRAAEECLSIYRSIMNTRDETLATYLTMLACVLAEANRFHDAVPYGEEALSLFIRSHGGHDSFVKSWEDDLECIRRGERREYIERGC